MSQLEALKKFATAILECQLCDAPTAKSSLVYSHVHRFTPTRLRNHIAARNYGQEP